MVHSCIYYEFNENIIDDHEFDRRAKELVELQEKYPEIAEKVEWADAFAGFDGSSGYHLPYRNPWVMKTAKRLLRAHGKVVD